MLKICFITEDFYPNFIGGQGIYGKELTEGLSKKVNLTIFGENRNGRREYWKEFPDVRLILVPFCFGNQLILALLEYLYFSFCSFNLYFDIVHANQLSSLFFILFKPKNVGKVVITVHHTNIDMYLKTDSVWKKILYKFVLIPIEKFVYESADGLIFTSKFEKNEMEKFYSITNIPKTIVNYGVNMIHFSQKDEIECRKYILKKHRLINNKIILYVGRLVRRKRVNLIIKVVKMLNEEKYPVEAIIIGKGSEFNNLKSISSENIHFLGFVDNIKPYFLAADVFISLSVGEGGVIISSLEAASFGLPLVLSNESANPLILKSGRNGFKINSDKPKEIATKLKKALANKELFRKQSLNLAKKLPWDRCVKETLNFYVYLQKT